MIKVLWTKEFITGNLSGQFVDAEIECADHAEANDWMLILNTPHARLTLEGNLYIAHQPRIVQDRNPCLDIPLSKEYTPD